MGDRIIASAFQMLLSPPPKNFSNYTTYKGFIMKKLPDDRTMSELLSMGKDLEDQARKVYEMSEAFAQKYEQRLESLLKEPEESTMQTILNEQ